MRKNPFDVCDRVEPAPDPRLGGLGRRDFLFRLGGGVGSVALSYLLHQDGFLAAQDSDNPLAPKAPHFPAQAKSCIFIFTFGAPSQMDTFDPKPALTKYHGSPHSYITGDGNGYRTNRIYVGSPFKFSKYGQSGTEVSEVFPHLASCVDDMAVVRSLHTDFENHGNATWQLNLGIAEHGNPSMGAWVLYGLGTENQNLPAFVVLPDIRGGGVGGGAVNWSSGYLPGSYQGTLLNPEGPPIQNLRPPEGITSQQQAANIRLINRINEPYLESNPGNPALLARMKNYELAFRMQRAVPEALNLDQESQKIKGLYGLGNTITEPMARKCLMARRLVERGVRFIQIYHHGWDHHEYLERDLRRRADESDRPIAGLLKDLKQRGLLDQTLVIWGGEFGRTADNEKESFRSQPGREHNKEAMVWWFAGGGVKGGTVVGQTDELGIKAVEDRYHLHDCHATMLHLMGLDDMRLTYYHGGRFKRLTDLGGRLIKQIIA